MKSVRDQMIHQYLVQSLTQQRAYQLSVAQNFRLIGKKVNNQILSFAMPLGRHIFKQCASYSEPVMMQ
ncbi:hypothetical protein GCM10027155_02880 [Acinetobacter apis]|uniref:Uncharacterized protein n=1 Tax=Acinetobacter apis TaxID=1229165 RepID=A0A217ED21_9GAMM|nr:hypothetical protein SAMN05444584_0292 [Acinetobacter apis]